MRDAFIRVRFYIGQHRAGPRGGRIVADLCGLPGSGEHRSIELGQQDIEEIVTGVAIGLDVRPAGLADDVELAERRLRREGPAGFSGRGPPRRGVPGPEDPQDGRIGSPPGRQRGRKIGPATLLAVAAIVGRRSTQNRSPKRCSRPFKWCLFPGPHRVGTYSDHPATSRVTTLIPNNCVRRLPRAQIPSIRYARPVSWYPSLHYPRRVSRAAHDKRLSSI